MHWKYVIEEPKEQFEPYVSSYIIYLNDDMRLT